MTSALRTVTLSTIGFAMTTALGYYAADEFLDRSPRPLARATWKERHASLASLAHSADAIVAGRVLDIRPGRSVAAGAEEDGVVQFSNVILRVIRVVKGEVQPGEDVIIEMVGDLFSGTEGKHAIRLRGMPNFRAGKRFLLFLKHQTIEPYQWYVLNNQAAFDLVRRGSVEVLDAVDHDDPVASRISDLTLPIAEERILATLRSPQGE